MWKSYPSSISYERRFKQIGTEANGGQKMLARANPKLKRNFSPEVKQHRVK
jgi:hypothetical protein